MTPPTYERLVRAWKLDDAEAVGAIHWLIGKIVAAIEDDTPPART